MYVRSHEDLYRVLIVDLFLKGELKEEVDALEADLEKMHAEFDALTKASTDTISKLETGLVDAKKDLSLAQEETEEVRAAREGVAFFDTSYFGKLFLTGPRADDAMQWLCAADLEGKSVGSVTYTPLCNARGGVEADLLHPLGPRCRGQVGFAVVDPHVAETLVLRHACGAHILRRHRGSLPDIARCVHESGRAS